MIFDNVSVAKENPDTLERKAITMIFDNVSVAKDNPDTTERKAIDAAKS